MNWLVHAIVRFDGSVLTVFCINGPRDEDLTIKQPSGTLEEIAAVSHPFGDG